MTADHMSRPMTLRDLLAAAAKGPWRVSLTDDTVVIGPDRAEVAAIDGDYNEPDLWPIMEANARLIALAPQLAEALIEVRERLSRLSRWLDTDAEILADLSDAVFADHHHICGEIAAALARIDAIMEGREDD